MGLYNEAECKEKLSWLLDRLTQLIAEDGRKPTVIKVGITTILAKTFDMA